MDLNKITGGVYGEIYWRSKQSQDKNYYFFLLCITITEIHVRAQGFWGWGQMFEASQR